MNVKPIVVNRTGAILNMINLGQNVVIRDVSRIFRTDSNAGDFVLASNFSRKNYKSVDISEDFDQVKEVPYLLQVVLNKNKHKFQVTLI